MSRTSTGSWQEARACLRVVRSTSTEKLPVRQHRQASRADHAVAVRVALRDVGRNEICAQDAFGRTGFLDFGDDRRLAGSGLGAHRPDKSHASARGFPHLRIRQRCLFLPSGFFSAAATIAVQDVTHGQGSVEPFFSTFTITRCIAAPPPRT